MLNTLEKLCSLPGVSGSEEEVRRYIRSEALKYTDDVYTDVMGSLIVTKRGKNKNAPRLMLADSWSSPSPSPATCALRRWAA